MLLFMVPADSDDIMAEYEVLLNELREFNPDLMDKPRVLAISKSDMLDDELIAEIEETLPEDLPHVFISAVTGMGLMPLKDMLWREITSDANRLATSSITHRPLDGHHRVTEEDEFIFEPVAAAGPDDDDELYDPDDDFDEFDFEDTEN